MGEKSIFHNGKMFVETGDITELSEETTSDGGTVTLKTHCYEDFVNILIYNGYVVTIERPNGTNKVNIEFYKRGENDDT